MSRIVIDARKLNSSTGRYHRELLSELEKLDSSNEYHIVMNYEDQSVWVPKNKKFFMHVVPYQPYTLGEQIGFAKFLYSLKPDLVHFLMPQQPLLYFGKRITSILDLTLVRFENIDKNRYVYRIEKFIFKQLLKNVAKRSSRIITISKFVKDDLQTFVKVRPNKVIVTHLASDKLAKIKSRPVTKLENKQFVMYVGQAFPHKNLERLAQAFSIVLKKYPKLQLVIAGKPDYFHKQLQERTKQIPNIVHLGFVSDEELNWLYQHSRAYVFPSLSEGFGLPGLEAMQHGVPVISSNTTSLPEIYGDAAHYFNPTSVEDIAHAIETVLRSKTRSEELVKNGFKQLEKFSWTSTAEKTHKAYLDVLKG